MKINEVKHNHSLTDLLKIFLFAILMLAPILSVATRCLYVVCNKNAYQSYEGATEQNITNEIVNNTDEFVEGKTYYFRQYNNVENRNYNEATNNIIASELTYNLIDYDNVRIGFYASGTSVYIYLRPTSDLTQLIYQSDMRYIDTSITFVFESISSQFSSDLLTYIYQKEYNSNYYMDNVFEYSVSKLATDQMFSWTANTPVFTGVEAMCTQLGITAPAIPIIIAYWLILACVYIVIDIVIVLITYITHMITRKSS